jgi:quercetin dioxygenase-like cupin family protein
MLQTRDCCRNVISDRRKEQAMRRLSALIVLVLVGSLGLTGPFLSHTTAQSATPAAALPPGVTVQPLAIGFGVLPAQTDFELFRWTLAPGTVFPGSPVNPAVALLYVESGTLTVQFTTPLSIERGSALAVLATPDVAMPGPEQVAADTAATLSAGDSVVAPLHAHGELRNEGSEPVVFLTALVTPRGQHELFGTPVP